MEISEIFKQKLLYGNLLTLIKRIEKWEIETQISIIKKKQNKNRNKVVVTCKWWPRNKLEPRMMSCTKAASNKLELERPNSTCKWIALTRQ